MKHLDKLIPMAMGLALLTSCADNDMPFFGGVTQPAASAQYAYLNEYDVLKNYINPNANPDFKLGLGVDAASFDAGNAQYQIAATNFNEVTPGNEMKYASIVANDGSMNFSTVTNFIEDAKTAGLTVYGHTLAWHSQQNNTYLNGLIAPEVILAPAGSSNCLKMHQDQPADGSWNGQVYYTLDEPLVQGTSYTLTFSAKATNPFNMGLKTMPVTEGDVDLQSVQLTTDWADYSVTFTPSDGNQQCIKFIVGDMQGDLYIDNLVLVITGSNSNLIKNGDFEDASDLSHWTKYSWHAVTYEIEESTGGGEATMVPHDVWTCDFNNGETIGGWGDNVVIENVATGGEDGSGCMKCSHPSELQGWEVQFAAGLNSVLTNGTTYKLSFKLKGSVAGTITANLRNAESYANRGDFQSINVTTDWQEFNLSATCNGDDANSFIFNVGNYVGDLYIDDVRLYYETAGGEIEKTPEEKKEILTNAMDAWITGVMNATGGYVTTWDAVNEAISGADYENPDDPSDPHIGYYDLQTSENGDPSTNFYWQDYLGKEDYVPIVTKLATQRFEEAGGDPSQLKLFINDYNLESWWDGNKKLKSLIHWIETWEAKGAKIDGIGTQMHVSYILNPTDQKAQEDAIVNMFQLMAATGKLVKISELDMGIVENAFGTAKKTEEVTYEEQLKMADFYKFIIEKYFEIIPQAQQYGITQWCCTNSPADSGWRGGEPCGLWDLNYSRTPSYGGFANGLAGQVIVEPSPVPGDGSDAGAVE